MKTNDELQKDVMAEIKWDSLLRDVYTQIGVTAKDGVITLSGVVDSYIRKVAAESRWEVLCCCDTADNDQHQP